MSPYSPVPSVRTNESVAREYQVEKLVAISIGQLQGSVTSGELVAIVVSHLQGFIRSGKHIAISVSYKGP